MPIEKKSCRKEPGGFRSLDDSAQFFRVTTQGLVTPRQRLCQQSPQDVHDGYSMMRSEWTEDAAEASVKMKPSASLQGDN